MLLPRYTNVWTTWLFMTLFMYWFQRFVRCWSFIDNVILSWKKNVLRSILVGGEVSEPPEMYSTNCNMYHLNFGKCSSGKSNFTFLEWSSCLTDLDSAGTTRAPCVAASRITRPHEDTAIVSCTPDEDPYNWQSCHRASECQISFRRISEVWINRTGGGPGWGWVSCSNVFDADDQYLEVLKFSWIPGHYIASQVIIMTIDRTD
jgi:hypothetical protein